MKILVIMKRFGANKDMVIQNFGRQIRLFEPLAKKHSVHFLCPDYRKKESKIITRNGIKYIIKPVSVFLIYKFISSLKNIIKKGKYDVIVATTDPLIGIVSYHYSKKYKVPLIYDLQDNFEAYDTYKLPFVGYFDKKAVKHADIVLSVSHTLKRYISKNRSKPIYVIQNGIELDLFKDINKIKSRKKLKLPIKSKIIVYIGNVERLKGGQLLIDSFKKIRKSQPDTYLLLSGKIDKSINIKQKNIIFRGFPKRSEVVLGLNAADVAVLPNPINKFTTYCFPYKLLEYMACNTPIVATDVGDVSIILKKYKESLCNPDDSDDLSKKIITIINKKDKRDYRRSIAEYEWKNLSKNLDRAIRSAVKN